MKQVKDGKYGKVVVISGELKGAILKYYSHDYHLDKAVCFLASDMRVELRLDTALLNYLKEDEGSDSSPPAAPIYGWLAPLRRIPNCS
jgi:hypothetical protein